MTILTSLTITLRYSLHYTLSLSLFRICTVRPLVPVLIKFSFVIDDFFFFSRNTQDHYNERARRIVITIVFLNTMDNEHLEDNFGGRFVI